jgi:hypothetical protein
MAMAVDGTTGTPVNKQFASSAPSRTPGVARYPNQSSAAIATPAGGHTGDTLTFTNANDNPSFAPTK